MEIKVSNDKVDYVKSQASTQPTSGHICHWPGCTKKVPAVMWGCKKHWYMLPVKIRSEIWRSYQPGQEIMKNPTETYLKAAKKAQDWIQQTYGETQ